MIFEKHPSKQTPNIAIHLPYKKEHFMVKNRWKNAALFSIERAKDIEIHDGVFQRRRGLLWLPLLAITAITGFSHPPQTAQTEPRPIEGDELDWEQFLKQCEPMSRQLHKDSSSHGQDVYLQAIAAMVARLNLKTIPQAKLGQFGTLSPPIEFGISYRGMPFFIVEWHMAAGAMLPPHCHPNASVCTLGIAGEARIRNFQIESTAPEFSSKESFQIRETHNEIITTGRINTLSSTRDNIHTFQAGKEGARGIDISTYHGTEAGFSFLEIEQKPLDLEKMIFKAVWKKF